MRQYISELGYSPDRTIDPDKTWNFHSDELQKLVRERLQKVFELDQQWTNNQGHLKRIAASEFLAEDPIDFFLWCFATARYLVPTIELVDWLKKKIAGRRAIEIGAGNGDLGRHLGIKRTDSRIQVNAPAMREFYVRNGVPPTDPPSDVMTMEALEAIKRLRPQVVVA